MTTSPVPSITDEQIAEIENYVNLYADPVIPPQVSYAEIAALIARLRAAEKDAARYRELRKVTPYQFKKMRDASITDGGDEYYFHANKFDSAFDSYLTEAKP